MNPPELLAGTSTSLTVVGKNFGVNMADTYLSRVYRNDIETGLVFGVIEEFDPDILPFNGSSVRWWDSAQYKLCFNAGADLSKSPYLAACNQGLVVSSNVVPTPTCELNAFALFEPASLFVDLSGPWPVCRKSA